MEDVEGLLELIVDVEDGGHVTASVAVIGRGPHCYEVLVSEPVLESVHYQLMGSGNQRDVVDVVEFSRHFGAKQPSGTSWRHGPSLDILWIGPHEVTEWTLMRNLHSSIDESDLINGLDLWGETTMDTEDLSLDDGADSKVVEDLSTVFPGIGISVLPDGLVVEPVDSGDLPGLVVTSQEGDVGGVLQLEAEEQLEGLH